MALACLVTLAPQLAAAQNPGSAAEAGGSAAAVAADAEAAGFGGDAGFLRLVRQAMVTLW